MGGPVRNGLKIALNDVEVAAPVELAGGVQPLERGVAEADRVGGVMVEAAGKHQLTV